MMNKKAVSPLIATVLIIGFTIVLAAVVMQWGGGFVRQLTEEQSKSTETATQCIGLQFDISSAIYGDTCDATHTCTTGTCQSGVCKDASGLVGTDDGIAFKVTSNVDKKIKSFVALLEHSDGTTDSLSADGTTSYLSGYCTVNGFSTTTCGLTMTVALQTNDKIKLVPMIETADGDAQACTIDSAQSRVVSTA